MQVIFHIGHHKTGTTSLQGFLAANAVRLLHAGVLYPWVESEGAAQREAELLGHPPLDPALMPANVREPHNALAFRMLAKAIPERAIPPHHRGTPQPPLILRAIRNQIEALNPETVVLVSEVMSHFGVDAPELIETLGEPFPGARLGLHVTLRRPDDQITAWYGQELWFGAPLLALSDPGSMDFDGIHFNYRAMIEPWLTGIPGIFPRIRAYRDVVSAHGSIADFFAQWSLEIPTDAQDVPKMNTSLPRALFPLLRAANANLPRPAARSLGPDLLPLVDKLDLPSKDDIEFFGADRRAELAERFSPINNWLAEINGAPLFSDMDEIARVRPVSEDDALAQVLAGLGEADIEGFSNPKVRAFVANLKAGR